MRRAAALFDLVAAVLVASAVLGCNAILDIDPPRRVHQDPDASDAWRDAGGDDAPSDASVTEEEAAPREGEGGDERDDGDARTALDMIADSVVSEATPDGGDGGEERDARPPLPEGGDACILNACEGCGVLSGTPGASCGSCGTYACSADKTSVSCSEPTKLTVKQVAAGGGHTCALLSSGGVRCWGHNEYGQLGDGSNTSRSSPPTTDAVSEVSAIALGVNHSCALCDPAASAAGGITAPASSATAPPPTAGLLQAPTSSPR